MSIVFALLTSIIVMSVSTPIALGTNSANSVLEIQVAGQGNIPSDATSVVLNIASARATADGYVVAWPCGSPQPETASLNYRKGQPISNATIIAIGDGGKICFSNSTDTDLIVDANAALTAAAGVVTANPIRLHDTRDSSPNAAGATLEIQLTGQNNVPVDSDAAVLNIAAARGAANGFVTAWPCGEDQPTASSLNYRAGEAVSNATIIAIGNEGKICLSSSTTADLIVDLNGIVSGSAEFVGGAPTRLVDTRPGTPNGAGATLEVPIAGHGIVPANATAAVINIAATNATTGGFVTAWPCGTSRPNAASLNYGTAGAISNSTTVGIGDDGKICLFTSTTVDLVIDVNGSFAGNDLATFPPVRLEDTRDAGTTGGDTTTTTGGDTTTTTGGDTTTTTGGDTTLPPNPESAQFVETFTGNTGLERFETGVFNREESTGTASGDHDLQCGTPDTQRTVYASDPDSSFYMCRDHLMTTVGDWAGYSVAWFTPKATFSGATTVSWDVNITDLLRRQWWEVSIVPTSFNSGDADCPYCSVISWLNPDPTHLPEFPAGSVVVGNGPFGGDVKVSTDGVDRQVSLYYGLCQRPAAQAACASKATRLTFSITDNLNGTVTVDYGGLESYTVPGSFPSDFRVVFKDHNYVPNKDDIPVGYTWHWDNIIVN